MLADTRLRVRQTRHENEGVQAQLHAEGRDKKPHAKANNLSNTPASQH